MASKKSVGIIVYVLASSCCWGLYVLGLILTGREVLEEYNHDEMHRSTIMKEVVTFLMVPQGIAALLYILTVFAFLIDMLSKERKRVHFLTTSYVNTVSMGFLLTAGFAMFINVALMMYVAINHQMSSRQYAHNGHDVGSGYHEEAVQHSHLIAGVEKQIVIIASRAKTMFICIAIMLGLYSVYFCYWPHSLRYRRRIDKRLLANMADADYDEDDNL